MRKQYVVIDDDQITIFLHTAIIKRLEPDANILGFINPQEAINYFKEEFVNNIIPSTILLDLNMPVVSGWELLDALKELDFNVRKNLFIFIVSSSLSEMDFQRAAAHPLVIEYLLKPLHTDRAENFIEYVNKQLGIK